MTEGELTFGQVLRAWREYRGLTVSALAERVGFQKGYISSIEHGRITRPRREQVKRLADGLEISEWDLIRLQLPASQQVESAPYLDDQVTIEGGTVESLITDVAHLKTEQRDLKQLITSELRAIRQILGQSGATNLSVSSEAPLDLSDTSESQMVSLQPHTDNTEDWDDPRRQTTIEELRSGNPQDNIAIAGEIVDFLRSSIETLPSDTIFVTNLNSGIMPPGSPLVAEWQSALQEALRRNWELVHLVRFERSGFQAQQFVSEMLALLGESGRYRPFYLALQPDQLPAYELILIPTRGALQIWGTQPTQTIETALHLSGWRKYAHLYAQIQSLRGRSSALFRGYPGLLALEDAVRRAEHHPGPRDLIKDGLSVLTRSTEILEWQAEPILREKPANPYAAVARRLIEGRRERQALFLDYVMQYRFRDLCPKSALIHLRNTGNYRHGSQSSDDKLVEAGGRRETPEVGRQHLRHLINLLRDTNYELGLLEAEHELVSRTYIEIKHGKAVFLDAWVPGATRLGEDEQLALEISEPRMIRALEEFFEDIWQSIGEENSNKEHVIGWLESLLT
jgi:transcriptional regulator with XRE-family HTH domain